MRILLDTSVLVAAMVEAHPNHEHGLAWLKSVNREQDEGLVAAHSVAELYPVLTTLPVQPPISPSDAFELIRHNVIGNLKVVSLSDEDYVQVIEPLAAVGIVGGATYDALILRAAENAQVDLVVTFNPRDFQRVCPDLADRIVLPQTSQTTK